MLDIINKSTVLVLLCLMMCLLSLSASTVVHRSGVSRVVVLEGDDAILPCSLSSKENIEQKLFDWKRDGQKEVFLYDAGIHYNNGRGGQDEQFQGRVSHFPEQLKFGNASITIRNTKLTDSGHYTCDFPHLHSQQISTINLVVEPTFKDRSRETWGAAPKPDVRILNATEDGVLLQCEVPGASPLPTVQWKDSDGKILHAEEPQVTHRVDRYYITLRITVTKTPTNSFYCVVTQEQIAHIMQQEIYVPFYEKTILENSCHTAGVFVGGWFSGVLTVAVPLALFLIIRNLRKRHKKGCTGLQSNGACNSVA